MFSISYASERIRKRLHDELRIPREQAARILSSIEKELNTFDPRQRSPRIKKQTIEIMAISQRGNAYD